MSIATELQDLNDNILDAYSAIQTKGGTVPAHKNMVNLPTAINSISGGGSFVGIKREVNANGVYGLPVQNFSFSLPSDAIDIGDYALYYAFRSCTALTSVDLSSLTAVKGKNAFGYAFNSCSNLTSVDLSSLTTTNASSIFEAAFSNCTSLTSVDLSSLTTVKGGFTFSNAFTGCTSLTSVSFPALTTSSFGSSTNQFSNMLSSCTGVTVHFPSAIQSTIGNWSDVTAGFGGTNTTVLFDL